MTAKDIDRFRRTEALFHAALEHQSGAQRDEWLLHQCAGDEELLVAVRCLLEDHEEVSRAACLRSSRFRSSGCGRPSVCLAAAAWAWSTWQSAPMAPSV